MRNLIICLVVSYVVMGCDASLSAPVDGVDETEVAKSEAEYKEEDYQGALADLETCEVAKDVCNTALVEAQAAYDESELVQRLRAELSSVYNTLDKAERDKAMADAKYEGMLEEYRKLQAASAVAFAEYREFRELCDLHAVGVWQTVEVEETAETE